MLLQKLNTLPPCRTSFEEKISGDEKTKQKNPVHYALRASVIVLMNIETRLLLFLLWFFAPTFFVFSGPHLSKNEFAFVSLRRPHRGKSGHRRNLYDLSRWPDIRKKQTCRSQAQLSHCRGSWLLCYIFKPKFLIWYEWNSSRTHTKKIWMTWGWRSAPFLADVKNSLGRLGKIDRCRAVWYQHILDPQALEQTNLWNKHREELSVQKGRNGRKSLSLGGKRAREGVWEDLTFIKRKL